MDYPKCKEPLTSFLCEILKLRVMNVGHTCCDVSVTTQYCWYGRLAMSGYRTEEFRRSIRLTPACTLVQVGQISAWTVLTPFAAGLYTGQGVSVWTSIPGVTEEVRDVEQQHKHER